MSIISLPKKNRQTTLREMLGKYLPAAKKSSESAPAGVRYIRHLAQQILHQTQDIADQTFDVGREHIVGKPIFDFINDEWTRALTKAERDKGGKISEAELVALINDDVARRLSDELRKRVQEATQDT